jgi:hypothetical protein
MKFMQNTLQELHSSAVGRRRAVFPMGPMPRSAGLWLARVAAETPPVERAHGSICVQEGEPDLRSAVGDTVGGSSHFERKCCFG